MSNKNTGKLISLCSSANYLGLVEFLNGGGKVPKGKLVSGDTLLHTVLRVWPDCHKDRYQIARMLLERGVSPLTPNSHGVNCQKFVKALLMIMEHNTGNKSEQCLFLKNIANLFRKVIRKKNREHSRKRNK
jgi:hypothetical protein